MHAVFDFVPGRLPSSLTDAVHEVMHYAIAMFLRLFGADLTGDEPVALLGFRWFA